MGILYGVAGVLSTEHLLSTLRFFCLGGFAGCGGGLGGNGGTIRFIFSGI